MGSTKGGHARRKRDPKTHMYVCEYFECKDIAEYRFRISDVYADAGTLICKGHREDYRKVLEAIYPTWKIVETQLTKRTD